MSIVVNNILRSEASGKSAISGICYMRILVIVVYNSWYKAFSSNMTGNVRNAPKTCNTIITYLIYAWRAKSCNALNAKPYISTYLAVITLKKFLASTRVDESSLSQAFPTSHIFATRNNGVERVNVSHDGCQRPHQPTTSQHQSVRFLLASSRTMLNGKHF